MKLSLLKPISLASAVLFLGFSVNSHAIDYKSLPGAVCQSYLGSMEGFVDKRVDGAYNNSNTYQRVTCSVSRDHLTTNAASAGMWVYATANTCCVGRSNNNDGSQVSANGGCLGGANGWINVTPPASAAWGSYVVYCSVPPQGRIATIAHGEQPDTSIR